ncbi:SRPBCC domain-containing protein [Mesorhizobium sp. CAU 1741]|uniref:SRPBCC domain-containing protein n=1 Tax=Mesorhizobium sp. CAU 1741 TaxID=3140366 RepID=UPI00325AC6FB
MTEKGRIDSRSRTIGAPADRIYDAFLSADAWLEWLPPAGMSGLMHAFDPRPGGSYRMELLYRDDDTGTGKSTDTSDIVDGTFVDFMPGRRVVQSVTFASDDPAFAGEMRMIWNLTPVAGGTHVTITCENVPSGILQADHHDGLDSTLRNLEAFVTR